MTDKDQALAIVVAVAVALVLFNRIRRSSGYSPRKPKERMFKCGRCAAMTSHSHRTVEAWRVGKTRFFCGACHSLWLKDHPAPRRAQIERSGSSGCLGLFALMAFLPLLAVAGWCLYEWRV